MGIAPTTFLRLRNVVVYRNLGHPLNLGLHFCRKFKARISYEGDQPCIEIQETRYPLVDSQAAGPGDQRRDQQPAQARRNLDMHSNRQISTFVDSYRKPRVNVAPKISITTMSISSNEGGSCGLRKNEIIMATVQPKQTVKAKQNIRPKKDKKVKLRQVEGQARIPKLELNKANVVPQASIRDVTLFLCLSTL